MSILHLYIYINIYIYIYYIYICKLQAIVPAIPQPVDLESPRKKKTRRSHGQHLAPERVDTLPHNSNTFFGVCSLPPVVVDVGSRCRVRFGDPGPCGTRVPSRSWVQIRAYFESVLMCALTNETCRNSSVSPPQRASSTGCQTLHTYGPGAPDSLAGDRWHPPPLALPPPSPSLPPQRHPGERSTASPSVAVSYVQAMTCCMLI